MTLLSTTSIDGRMMNMLTETKIKQTVVEEPVKKKMDMGAMFGGGK